jgi:phage shock protein A
MNFVSTAALSLAMATDALAVAIEQLQAVETHAAMHQNQAADARVHTREAEASLAVLQETCSELRQQKAGPEAQLASRGQAKNGAAAHYRAAAGRVGADRMVAASWNNGGEGAS